MSIRDRLLEAGFPLHAAEAAATRYGSAAELAHASARALEALGISRRKAKQLRSAIQLGVDSVACEDREHVDNAQDVFLILKHRICQLEQEVFFVLAVDTNQRLLDWVEIALGTVAGVEVHPREVFRVGIRLGASGIVLAHNHPSGRLAPSTEDIELTRRLIEVGRLLGIPVVDHVVLTKDGCYSIAEHYPKLMTGDETDGSDR